MDTYFHPAFDFSQGYPKGQNSKTFGRMTGCIRSACIAAGFTVCPAGCPLWEIGVMMDISMKYRYEKFS